MKWSVGAVFDFEDGGGSYDFDAVPLAGRDLHAIVALGGIKEVAGGLGSEVVVEDDIHFASEDYVCFGGVAMAVYGERRAREEHVDEALSLGIEAVVEVVVHAEARASGSLCGDFVE